MTAFILFFVGIEAIAGLVYALMLIPVNVEKTVGKKQAIIRQRQKAACDAEGKVCIEPEVRAAEEQKEQDAEAEEIYRKELKERCEQKGLNYDELLEKHVEEVRLKEEKQAEKERLAAIKAEEKAKIAADKQKAKLEAMSEAQRKAYEERRAARADRDEKKWQAEREKGEAIYEAMQRALAEAEAKAQ